MGLRSQSCRGSCDFLTCNLDFRDLFDDGSIPNYIVEVNYLHMKAKAHVY